jgi:hypothetical protein
LFTAGMSTAHGLSNQDVSAAIADANNSLQSAFVAVIDAENAGMNVSVLISKLNQAGANLTMAELAFDNGNYQEALSQAGACKISAENVAANAVDLESHAPGWPSRIFSNSEIGLFAAGGFVMALLLTWFWFRGYYTRKLTRSLPEVAS